MFFVVETTNGRGMKEQFCIPAKSGESAEYQIQNSDLAIENKGSLGWHEVSIASQQHGNEIIFETSINGQHVLIYPNNYGYLHLKNQFHEQVVVESTAREEEYRRDLEEDLFRNDHPFG
ncbi:MAG: hypothetical protein ACSHXJ_08540 [Marinomonas colpomeniae]